MEEERRIDTAPYRPKRGQGRDKGMMERGAEMRGAKSTHYLFIST